MFKDFVKEVIRGMPDRVYRHRWAWLYLAAMWFVLFAACLAVQRPQIISVLIAGSGMALHVWWYYYIVKHFNPIARKNQHVN